MNKFLLLYMIIIQGIITAQVTIRDTTINWITFNYTLNEDLTVNWATDAEYDIVEKTFSGKIIENEYLKVTLLPEMGGRILSMIYKPTGHEQLYQNPVGVPYGIGEDWFYYKWLMVYGGIFPTLPEPEHGKAWLLPWSFELVKQTVDTVTCRMSWTDNVELQGIDINKWKYGNTGLTCEFFITMVKGKISLDTEFILSNDKSENLDYEFWTCLTLAPGSAPGDPKCTSGAEIIIPATKIKIPSWYPDIASQEESIPGEWGKYKFDNLRFWANWTNDGIAYPWDDSNENYWGLINHDNEEGIIRVADNSITPGIKIWAWGYNQSQNIDPYTEPHNSRRPYVELWAGHSNEFFESAQIEMNSVKKWKETYIPTVGLANVTNATEELIADFKIDNQAHGNVVNFGYVYAHPNENLNIELIITGRNPQTLLNQSILPNPSESNIISTELPSNQTWMDEDSLICIITNLQGENIFTASLPLNNVVTDLHDYDNELPENFYLSQNYPNPFNPTTVINYSLPIESFVTMKVYDIVGRQVAVILNEKKSAGNYSITFNSETLSSGIYFYRIQAGEFTVTRRMVMLK